MSNGFHKISYQDAKNYILRFVSQDDLYSIASSMALGGTINRSVFDSMRAIYPGSIGWFCFNYNSVPEYPRFFVAIETAGVRYNTLSDPPPQPVNSTLNITKDVFTYTLEATMECVEFFLDHQVQICNRLFPITDSIVIDFKDFFINNFPTGNFKNPHNEYACAFFEETAVNAFIDQGPYVRYYFGYDNSPGQLQKIRLILFSVDGLGRNIVSDPSDTSKDAIILERHWPPDPPI